MIGSRQRAIVIYRGLISPRESEKVGLRIVGGFDVISVGAVGSAIEDSVPE
jgi:hypothetical protein